MRAIVVTGVSTGIGFSVVETLLANGFTVFGSVRKQEDATRLQATLGENFRPLVFDITDDAAIAAAAGEVRQALDGEKLAGLVNNAGVATPGPLAELGIDSFRHQIAVNLIGQLAVTQAFLPLLGTDRSLQGTPGRIVMMSSVSGQTGVAFLGPYAASKHALEGMSKSLRQEMIVFGIGVIVVAPGAVATPIWEKADGIDLGEWERSPFHGPLTLFKAAMQHDSAGRLQPDAVAKVVLTALTAARPKARYVVARQSLLHRMLPVIPQGLLDRVIGRQYGLSDGKKKPDQ